MSWLGIQTPILCITNMPDLYNSQEVESYLKLLKKSYPQNRAQTVPKICDNIREMIRF